MVDITFVHFPTSCSRYRCLVCIVGCPVIVIVPKSAPNKSYSFNKAFKKKMSVVDLIPQRIFPAKMPDFY